MGRATLELLLEDRTWIEVAGHLLRPDEINRLNQLPKTTLLSSVILFSALTPRRAEAIIKQCYPTYIPEINQRGDRRCVFIHNRGERCLSYNTDNGGIVCKDHFERAYMISSLFKSPMLKEAFNHYLSSNEKLSLDNEIAMQRTMLHVLVERMDDGNLSLQDIAAVTALCDKISAVVERSAKLHQLTPESVNKLLSTVVDILTEFVPADKLTEVAAKLESVNPLKKMASIPYEPSNEVMIKDVKYRIEGTSLKQQALMETAKHLGIDTDSV